MRAQDVWAGLQSVQIRKLNICITCCLMKKCVEPFTWHGEAYEECKGFNKSAIHMDIVKDMTSRGSSVVADGTVILKDGKIVA